MKAVNRVWSALEVYVQALSFLLALFVVFSVAAPKASAATLSADQQTSIVNLLVAFDADQATIDRVKDALTSSAPAGSSAAANAAVAASGEPAPVCTLVANKGSVAVGDTVTLMWNSENATYASMPGGAQGAPQGTISIQLTGTTTFIKKVYGPGGEATCSATVLADNGVTAEATPSTQITTQPLSPGLAQLFSDMQAGAAVLAETYFSWWTPTSQ